MRELPFDLHFDGGDSLDLFTADVRTRFCMGARTGRFIFAWGAQWSWQAGLSQLPPPGRILERHHDGVFHLYHGKLSGALSSRYCVCRFLFGFSDASFSTSGGAAVLVVIFVGHVSTPVSSNEICCCCRHYEDGRRLLCAVGFPATRDVHISLFV